MTVRVTRLRPLWLAVSLAVVAGAVLLGVSIGPAGLPARRVLVEIADRFPLVDVDSGLSEQGRTIVWELRVPRVVLGLLVGSMLALAGGAYQGVFRNPLADPYLLGVAAGAGLGATVAIVATSASEYGPVGVVPIAAFGGALAAVLLAYLVGAAGERRRSPATLILAGVAVASLLTAMQTFLQQRSSDTVQQVYSWILGRLTVAGWDEVVLLLPYVGVASIVLLAHRRVLDVMSVGDDEATTLGLRVDRTRLAVVVAASLGTAAAVSVSGLIGFVGIIVPHTVRLIAGSSYRVILPVSALLGGAFLVLADLLARTLLSPAEIPIGVITAFFGAPFFVLLLRTRKLAPV
jgi:iron complex transport system permease protein